MRAEFILDPDVDIEQSHGRADRHGAECAAGRALAVSIGRGADICSASAGRGTEGRYTAGRAACVLANRSADVASNRSPFIFDARIRKIDARGIITTVAGAGTLGYSGDGGPALSATLSSPIVIAFDSYGNLYFADDAENPRVRKVDKKGIITTVAGGAP